MKLQFNLQWEGEKKHRLLWKCSKLAALITCLIVQKNLKKWCVKCLQIQVQDYDKTRLRLESN